MTTTEQRNLIRSKIEAGASPQQVYDELHGPGSMPDEKLADDVRYVPILERRMKYRTGQMVLIGLLAVALAWSIFMAIAHANQHKFPNAVVQATLGIGFALALYAVAKCWRHAHSFAGLLGFLAVMRSGNPPVTNDSASLLPVLLLGATAVLAFWLQRKLTPAYITLKEAYLNADGQQRLKQVVRFGN
ncbi:MAG: hypothetical protein JSS84_10580 [Bacteroidetes bacterium]|nr:hypothetical protein [Bacteroidota bacterium]